jgi:delta 1-pyrroline-5-carboxylate dehydrogenase
MPLRLLSSLGRLPMQIAGRTIGAARARGDACVLRPAEEACLTSLALADLAREAGFPSGALNVVPGLGEEAGAALASHPSVRHLSFTGSVAVGALVQAAAARHVAPVTLELGGKSPQIVFADADLDRALPFLVNAGIQNAGETCSAASRILVERSCCGEVVERMADRDRALRVGPADADLDVGPLISDRQKVVAGGFIREAAELTRAAEGTIVPDARPAAIRCGRPCSPTSSPTIAWRRRKSSARCRWSSLSTTRRRRFASPTRPATASSRVCGERMADARCASPRRCARARCSSTITAAPASASRARA